MKIAFLSNFTIDLLAQEFKKYYGHEVYISGFNQYQLELKNGNSEYFASNPDFTLLILDWDTCFKTNSQEALKNEICEILGIITSHSNNYLIINNAYFTNPINFSQRYNVRNNIKHIQSELNLFLSELAYQNSKFFVLDILSIVELYGSYNIYDNSSWVFARNRFSKRGTREIAKKIFTLINAIKDDSKKCLVVDLDNTLWGGILNEDGCEGITLGVSYAGEEYKDFQRALKVYKENGALLCICSKNDYEDVKNVFEIHPHMILSFDDFIIKKINWQRKDLSIKEIAQELNIAEESIVFIDDNPAERLLVRQNTSACVPEFPVHVEDLRDFTQKIDEMYFPKFMLTPEDKLRSEMYVQNFRRKEAKENQANYKEFIKSLKIELTVKIAQSSDFRRIAQMTQKTNQFNLSQKKYSENEIGQLSNSPCHRIFIGNSKDKFGDDGTVLLMILEIENGVAKIDTFLMSCRVIGRFLENHFICKVAKELTEVTLFSAEYIPTKKNLMVENKLRELGFSLDSVNGSGKKYSCLTKELICDKL